MASEGLLASIWRNLWEAHSHSSGDLEAGIVDGEPLVEAKAEMVLKLLKKKSKESFRINKRAIHLYLE